jgi:ribosomal protein S12 methylthiotransferase
MRFERMGCFAYSDEEGTYAHRHYTDDIPTEVKEARAAELMAIQQDISRELMQGFVGKTEKVIIDREEGEYFIGRTQYDSPEVDCEVLIEKSKAESQKSKDKSLKEGEFYDVLITRAEEFDLYGELRIKQIYYAN